MTVDMNSLAFLGLPGGSEWIVIAIFGLLLFGKRLPEVGKSLGQSIVEFKKGLRGVEHEIDKASQEPEMLPPPDKAKAATDETGAQTKTTTSA
jgi:sec-independent protein translocase protein TatA